VILFRVGLVLTAVMGLANTVNGGSALLGMQGDDAAPGIAWLLFGVGLPTLLLVGTAWVPRQWALWTVIALRSLEALTMWIPFGPGDWYQAPENRSFYVTLVVASVVVCALMALGLRRRKR
jgi:fatty acid desaturase